MASPLLIDDRGVTLDSDAGRVLTLTDRRAGELTHTGTFKDPDGTVKAVFERDDKEVFEITLLKNKHGVNVFCIPSHHYCSLGCKFCHLTADIGRGMQPVRAEHLLECLERTAHHGCRADNPRRTSNSKLLLSFMGVGELALNLRLLEGVRANQRRLHDIGYEQVGYAMATMSPGRNLARLTELVLAERIPMKVHFSLHTPIEADRRELLPGARICIEEALSLVCAHRDAVLAEPELTAGIAAVRSSSDPVEMHYTLIDGVNDTDRHLQALIELQCRYMVPLKFLHFNETAGLKRSPREQQWLDAFAAELPELPVVYYDPPGHCIGASCGEFTKHYYLSEIETAEQLAEFENWRARYRFE